MIKIALIAVAVAATGTTAYVVTRPDPAPAHHATTTPSVEPARSATLPAPPAQRHVTPPPAAADMKPTPANGATNVEVPSPDDQPLLDRATIERTHLYRGPSHGPADAPVTIVVFTDLMCTHCGQVLGTIDQLMDEYRGKLRLVVKQFPVHKAAVLAAEAALAADAQGKFWEMHDLMLANQTDLSHDALIDYARQVGLDVDQFRTALDTHAFADAVKADQQAGQDIDIQATPSFVINGKRYVGALPIEEFRAAIDEALANPAP